MKLDQKDTRKEPYHRPRLRIYANLRELTEARNSMGGDADGSSSPPYPGRAAGPKLALSPASSGIPGDPDSRTKDEKRSG